MKKIQFLLLIVLYGCSTMHKSANEAPDSNEVTNDYIKISYNQSENNIDFKLQNINKQLVYYVKKNVLEIEKYTDGEWLRVKILPCPCGAPCRELKSEVEIKPNETISIKWNMIESWCDNSSGNGFVKETISKKVGKGRYKVKLIFKYDSGSIFQVNKEFNIN